MKTWIVVTIVILTIVIIMTLVGLVIWSIFRSHTPDPTPPPRSRLSKRRQRIVTQRPEPRVRNTNTLSKPNTNTVLRSNNKTDSIQVTDKNTTLVTRPAIRPTTNTNMVSKPATRVTNRPRFRPQRNSISKPSTNVVSESKTKLDLRPPTKTNNNRVIKPEIIPKMMSMANNGSTRAINNIMCSDWNTKTLHCLNTGIRNSEAIAVSSRNGTTLLAYRSTGIYDYTGKQIINWGQTQSLQVYTLGQDDRCGIDPSDETFNFIILSNGQVFMTSRGKYLVFNPQTSKPTYSGRLPITAQAISSYPYGRDEMVVISGHHEMYKFSLSKPDNLELLDNLDYGVVHDLSQPRSTIWLGVISDSIILAKVPRTVITRITRPNTESITAIASDNQGHTVVCYGNRADYINQEGQVIGTVQLTSSCKSVSVSAGKVYWVLTTRE